MFILPTRRIPEWFEYQTKGESISFWFRNKLPAIALCVAFECRHYRPFDPVIVINSNERSLNWRRQYFSLVREHTHLFDLQTIKLEDNLDEALAENEWNHAVLSCKGFFLQPHSFYGVEFGIHQFKEKTNMEDIRFTDPYKRRKLDDGLCSPES